MGFFYLPNYISEPGIPKSIYIYVEGLPPIEIFLPARLSFFLFCVVAQAPCCRGKSRRPHEFASDRGSCEFTSEQGKPREFTADKESPVNSHQNKESLVNSHQALGNTGESCTVHYIHKTL